MKRKRAKPVVAWARIKNGVIEFVHYPLERTSIAFGGLSKEYKIRRVRITEIKHGAS